MEECYTLFQIGEYLGRVSVKIVALYIGWRLGKYFIKKKKNGKPKAE